MKKCAIFTMDVEDWFHLDYYNNKNVNYGYSTIEGVDNYLDWLKTNKIKSTFFILGELAIKHKDLLHRIDKEGHEIGSHGWNHKRPLLLPIREFREDIIKSKKEIENIIGKEIYGYRAPCFSLDRNRLNIIFEEGYKYDSSKIDFNSHPLYGSLNITDYEKIDDLIYAKNSNYEFEITTKKIFSKNIPISGGGYLRIFPWVIMRTLINNHLKHNNIYNIYIHPYELTKKTYLIPAGKEMGFINNFRFKYGNKSIIKKLNKLKILIRKNDFKTYMFKDLLR